MKIRYIVPFLVLFLTFSCNNIKNTSVKEKYKEVLSPQNYILANIPDINFRKYLKGKFPKAFTKEDQLISNHPTIVGFSGEISLIADIKGQGANDIYSVSGIEYFKSLKVLDIEGHPITELDVSKNTSLKELIIAYSHVKKLDLNNNKELILLDCQQNNISCLKLAGATKLKELVCKQNNLKKLDTSENKRLVWFDCCINQLTSLDVSENCMLTGLNCSYNKITSLDVRNIPTLTWLDCASNKIEQLDVSKNTVLARLDCITNELNYLDISQQTDWVDLSINDGSQSSPNNINNPINTLKVNISQQDNDEIKKIKMSMGMNVVISTWHKNSEDSDPECKNYNPLSKKCL